MNRLVSWLNEASNTLKRNFLTHPAVSISLLFTAVAVFFIQFDGTGHEEMLNLEAGLTMVPWAIMLALVMDHYLGKFDIKPSLASLIVIAVGMCFPIQITDWIGEPSFNIIYFIVLPLVLVTYRMRVSDRSFMREVIWNMFSLGVAMLVAMLFICIFCGIIISCQFLFDMSHNLEDTLFDLVYSIAIALGGFIFVCVGERENYRQINMLVQPVSNYLIAPALLIYTIVLIVYILKIVIEQTLPDGGVAIMCIIWSLASLYVAASQKIFVKHPFMWFSKIYGLIAIPIVIMLWVAAFRRVSDYGITPYRYYLLLSALTATVCVIIALFRRRNLYYIFAVSTAAAFLCSIILPWVNYRSVTGYSQVRIIRTEADALGKLHDDGTIDSYGYVKDDAHGKKIISAVSVLKQTHPASLSKLGLTKDTDIVVKSYEDSYRESIRGSERKKIEPEYVNLKIKREKHIFGTDSYSRILLDPETSYEYGLVKVSVPGEWEKAIRCSEFIEKQLRKCGLESKNVTASELKSHQNELLIYDGEGYRLILDEFSVTFIDGKEVATNWINIEVKAVLFN